MDENSYPSIIEKARELSQLLKQHPVTLRYQECLEKMKHDKNAQALMEKLVMLGRDINSASMGLAGEGPGDAERALVEEELEKNPLVKEHLLAQKEYLAMIQQMQERIRNPK